MEIKQKEQIRNRVQAELQVLRVNGGIIAELVSVENQDYVVFRQLETSGGHKGLPTLTDVLVMVPEGYPSTILDMPAIHIESPLKPHLVGGSNPQGIIDVQNKRWQFLSFHPYSGDWGPTWNPNKHGFHDYYQHLFTWLHKIQ